MNLLYPAFAWAGGALAAAVFALHWLTTRQRQPVAFPTLRFIPAGALQTTALQLRLSDRRLLLLRLLIVLLLGFAFAQPQWQPPGSVARLLLVDGSASVARSDAWREQVLAAANAADRVLVYDGTVHTLDEAADVQAFVQQPAPAQAIGPLSPALLAALQHGQALRERARRVDVSIISPFLAASFDAATPEIRALWPGELELQTVAAETDAQTLASAFLPVEVHWADRAAAHPDNPWQARPQPEPHNGVYTEAATLLAPFQRRWQLAEPLPTDSRVIAWWIDGEPAAIERTRHGVRQRWLAFSLPEQGDATLRPAFVRFNEWLESPADLPFGQVPLTAQELQAFVQAPANPPEPDPSMQTRPLALWLLGLALLLVLLEPLLRRWLAEARQSAAVTEAGETRQ
ncbi:N-terminal double-transmembrane domain-containing protein [Lampropedia hyalina DSM 16112]|jgi:hypothetical protein|uniref:N-terminal double-transmembrane domain-containing protein n=1 Tax=Lampropedia hyalina DSM 16112 TaxID=1122156 RepID=A0A1M4ZER2_9BURK|nr:BatA domain-containing protein [Lampropedia hyalina]SHF16549.1 N-terminal double-transmembrane domain-containing protein [Lampropedia hyalina DSM 16112]